MASPRSLTKNERGAFCVGSQLVSHLRKIELDRERERKRERERERGKSGPRDRKEGPHDCKTIESITIEM
jgi:hypothetical protein